jgi:hypothetical protein
MRFVSSTPFFPTSTLTSFIFSLPVDIYFVFLLQIECHTRRNSDLGSKAQPCRCTGSGNCVRGTRLRVEVLRARWCAGLVPGQPAHEETCPTPQFSCSFMTPPSLWPSLNLISSAATLSSLHFLRTSPHIFYYFTPFHLTLPARHAQPPAAVPIPTPPAAPFPSTPAPTPSRPRRRHHAIRPR